MSGPPQWVSLVPVISQRFDYWSYEPYESPLSFPMRGEWEGSISPPKNGSYRLKVANSFPGTVDLRVARLPCFQSLSGTATLLKEIRLEKGRSYPLRLHAGRIEADNALRLLVASENGPWEPVPSSWLMPAPLPPPSPLK
jgi:hypothetical protein